MRWRIIHALVLAAAFAGCAAEPRFDDGLEARTHRYVVSVLRIPRAEGDTAFGFDLDGVSSAGDGASCVYAHADFFSATDGMQDGVDNELAALVPALDSIVGGVDETIRGQIASGSLLIVVEVAGIESYRNDSAVSLRLYRGTAFEGMPVALEADGTLSPGQEFDLEPVGAEIPGTIVNGRVRGTFDLLEIPLRRAAGDAEVVLELHDVHLRANLSQTTLADGAIGGAIDVADLERIPELASTIISGDLEPEPGDETTCRALSAGLSFTAIDHVDDFDDGG